MSLLGDGDGVNLAFNLAAALAMFGVGANSRWRLFLTNPDTKVFSKV